MENEDLTKTEIVDLVVKYNNNNTQQMLFFIKNDCSIKFDIKTYYNQNIYTGLIDYKYNIEYGNKLSNIQFHNFRYNDITCIYKSDSRNVLISLFELLSDKEIENIKNITLKMEERKKINDNKNTSSPLVKIDNINNNTNTLSNTNNNSNSSDIKTYSNLRSFIENSNSIENKSEIINLIKELEESKDDENKEDYIDKFLKLLELLENILPIPPAIIKGAKIAKKFFDSIRGKNEK